MPNKPTPAADLIAKADRLEPGRLAGVQRESPPDLGTVGRLIARRGELGLTQAQLAERMGVAQPRVAEWEGGKTTPGLDTVERWADALGLVLHLIDAA